MGSSDARVQAEGCSALSSTYYSIVGTAFSQLKTARRRTWLAPVWIIAWCFTWLPLAAWCYVHMLLLSNRIVRLIGYEGMSGDQCDVRQSILRRRGRYHEAKTCIHAALAKKPQKAHTRALLHIGLADTYQHDGALSNARKELQRALAEAPKAEKQDPRQAARIYRHCADIIDLIDQGNPLSQSLRCKVQELAQAANARDQLLKLR